MPDISNASPPDGSTPIALFLSDIDGTLVNAEKEITERTKNAVQQLREVGIEFTVTSSRPPRGLRHIVEELKITAPIAAFNGGIYVAPDGTILEEHTLPPDIVRETVRIFQEAGLKAWVFRGQHWFVLDGDRHGPHVDRESHTVRFEPTLVDSLDALPGGLDGGEGAAKIVGVSDDPDTIQKANSAVKDVLGKRASVVMSQSYYIDVTHPEATKGAVVAYLARHMNISPSAIATIGDQPNDINMFVPSGFSIAMGNAGDEVKRAATVATAPNTADGFAEAVERFILPRATQKGTPNK